MTLLEIIAKRMPEMIFKHTKDDRLVTVVTGNNEITEGFLNGQLYRIIIQRVEQ